MARHQLCVIITIIIIICLLIELWSIEKSSWIKEDRDANGQVDVWYLFEREN